MKKSTVLYCLLLTIALFPSCNEPFFFEQGGDVFYNFEAKEIMSDFSNGNLTLLINLDIEDLQADILADVMERQPGLVDKSFDITHVGLNDTKIVINQSEENITEEVKSNLENIELVLNNVTTSTETVITNYKSWEESADLEFFGSNFNFSGYDFADDLENHDFEYFFRLTFSEKPNLELLNLIPEISFSYECFIQD